MGRPRRSPTRPSSTRVGSTILGAETVTTVYDAASSMPSWMSGGFGWGVYVASSRFAADGRPLLTDLGNTYGAVASYRLRGRHETTDRDQPRPGTHRRHRTEPGLRVRPGRERHQHQGRPDQRAAGRCRVPGQPVLQLRRPRTPADRVDTRQRRLRAGTIRGRDGRCRTVLDQLHLRRPRQPHQADQHRAGGTATTTTYAHGAGAAGPHAVTSATTAGATTTYGYDAAGNRTSVEVGDVTTGYMWDAEGELTTVGDTSNVYDADGNRIVRTDANGTTVYAGGQEIHIATNGTVKATRYYSFAGQTVAIRTDRGLGNGVTLPRRRPPRHPDRGHPERRPPRQHRDQPALHQPVRSHPRRIQRRDRTLATPSSSAKPAMQPPGSPSSAPATTTSGRRVHQHRPAPRPRTTRSSGTHTRTRTTVLRRSPTRRVCVLSVAPTTTPRMTRPGPWEAELPTP